MLWCTVLYTQRDLRCKHSVKQMQMISTNLEKYLKRIEEINSTLKSSKHL